MAGSQEMLDPSSQFLLAAGPIVSELMIIVLALSPNDDVQNTSREIKEDLIWAPEVASSNFQQHLFTKEVFET